MKKQIQLSLVLAASLGLVACGDRYAPPSNKPVKECEPGTRCDNGEQPR